jgi:hypothetical protein
MSYDLFLRELPSDVLDWLGEREHYGVSDTQAAYHNENTGVYFTFDQADDGLAFNLNYFRPHVFGLEAEREVTALVEKFRPEIEDPQSEGMGEGPYSPEGFLRGWNAGNLFAHRVMRSHQEEAPLTLPAATLEWVWRWNYEKEHYQDELNTAEMVSCFVPTIWLLSRPSEPARVLTACVWGEAMPIALPEVDVVLVVGQPIRLLWRAELAAAVEKYEHRERHCLLEYRKPPLDLIRAIEAHAFEDAGRPTRLSPDSVLTREVFERSGADTH